MPDRSPLLLAVALAVSVVAPLPAATPIVVSAAGGHVTLPMTGLAVALPERKDVVCKINGRWNLTDGNATFWSRDTIDEFDPEGKLIAGNRVSAGYFDAGEAAAVVKEVTLTEDWNTTTNLWGLTWQVRGGNYAFDNSLGVKPAIVLATTPGKGKPSLLLYHFFIQAPADLSPDDMIAGVRDSPTLSAAFQAYWADQWAPTQPTRHEAVVQPEEDVAHRVIDLPVSGLHVRLPDDGFVWLHERKPSTGVDMFYRMAPSLPDITVELMLVDATGVRSAFTQIGLEKNPWDAAPANLPPDWESGPTITTPDGIKETTVAKIIGGKVLVVGFMVTPRLIDTGPYQPLLEAVAEAVVHPAAPSEAK
jgi:hypothetical protein